MTRQDLINQVTEELKIGSELGYEYDHTAKNVVAIFEGSRDHLDYDSEKHEYEWEGK